MEQLIQDTRHAIRSLTRAPAFAGVAVATLALGIGADTALFSVVRSVLLSPLPYSDPDGIVMVWNRWKSWDKTWLSLPEVLDYRERCGSFAEVASWYTTHVNLTGAQEPERVAAGAVSASLFRVLGVEAVRGRTFTEQEDAPGADDVVVLGYGLWRRRYGSDPAIIGRRVRVDGRARTVLGIMPASFRLPLDYRSEASTEIWLPLGIDTAQVDRTERGDHHLYGVARLAAGITPSQADAELRRLTRQFTEEGLYPVEMGFETYTVPVTEEVVGGVRPALLLLLGAVGLVLLIACANVGNLLLARAEDRQREMALRAALGAGTGRIVRQLLTEGVVLSLAGGVGGLALAHAASRTLVAWAPPGVPRIAEVAIDLPVLLFALALSLLTAMIFSLFPALHTAGAELSPSLREGSGSLAARASRRRLASATVAAEMALALVLVVGASLLLRSFHRLVNVDKGFETDQVLTFRLSLPETDYPEPEDVVAFYERCLNRLRALPGVISAGAVRVLPLAGVIGDWSLLIEGRPAEPGNHPKGDWQVVSLGTFETMGMRLLQGRLFTDSDGRDGPDVAVINQTMASKYWPGKDPIGKRFQMGTRGGRPWITIVGIVGDVTHAGLGVEIKEKFYRPHAQFHRSTGWSPRSMTVVLKANSDPLGLVGPIRAAVRAIDPHIPVADVQTMSEVVADAVSAPRFTTFVLSLFAAAALLLAIVGIYGVLSHAVSRRRHEIGIRMALGAEARQVRRLVLRQGAVMSGVGLVLGLILALGLRRLLSHLALGLGATDALTWLFVPPALLAVALAASYLPARRATTIDPIHALKME